jgi:predicted amidohydrolase
MRIRACAIGIATTDGAFADNYRRALDLTAAAGGKGAQVILLPEAFAAGYCAEDLSSFAETLADSPYLQAFARLSERHRCLIALGFIERTTDGPANTVALFDGGRLAGIHRKVILWPDDARPWRDERRLVRPGAGFDAIRTSLGRIGILTCYENMVPAGWAAWHGRVDLVLSPYNCEDDPSRHNVAGSRAIAVPSLWANRTGTTYCGPALPSAGNPGTSGAVDAAGTILVRTRPGAEETVEVGIDLG